jgi:hypothetical protein
MASFQSERVMLKSSYTVLPVTWITGSRKKWESVVHYILFNMAKNLWLGIAEFVHKDYSPQLQEVIRLFNPVWNPLAVLRTLSKAFCPSCRNSCDYTALHLKGLSYEIDFENVDEFW